MMSILKLQKLFLVALLAVLLAGCGAAHEKKIGRVSGVVRLEGQPVTEGYVMFRPVPADGADPLDSGKSASGIIKSDGSFTMTTYHEGDGAMVGKHMVSFYKPDPEDDEQVVVDPFIPGGKEFEVEVQPGSNVFEIDLFEDDLPMFIRRDS